MEKIRRMMMDLINAEIFGREYSSADFGVPTNDELKALYKLSKSHDLVHIVADALIKRQLIEDENVKNVFEAAIMSAVFRYENINGELETIKKALSEAKIPFIPLKGSVIRKFYPEPWLRTSCDIDVLIHENDVKAATEILTSKFGFTLSHREYHDYSFYSVAGVHLELHFSIKEDCKNLDSVLVRAWDYAYPLTDGSYEYAFTNEFFIFHVYAHAAHHFKDSGGCGIRPFIDVKLLKQNIEYDAVKLASLLSEAKISVFADNFDKLYRAWFDGGEYDETALEMEAFVLNGGVYGNVQNRTATRRTSKKGAFRNLWARLWLPYETLCEYYPKLKGRRILQPFYEIKRWFKLFKKDVRKRSVNEIKVNTEISEDKVASAEKMLKDLGLSE